MRRARNRGEIAVNPTVGLELPASRGRRERIATVVEAERLIGALPRQDRALWATALYAGLRRGELQALRSPQTPAPLPCLLDRRGRQRQGSLRLHGALEHHDHARPLRPPHARERRTSRKPARCLLPDSHKEPSQLLAIRFWACAITVQ